MSNLDEELNEEIEKKIDEVLRVERWKSDVSGKVEGGLAVLAILDLEKEERIRVLAKALKLTIETATSFVNRFYEEEHYDLFDN